MAPVLGGRRITDLSTGEITDLSTGGKATYLYTPMAETRLANSS